MRTPLFFQLLLIASALNLSLLQELNAGSKVSVGRHWPKNHQVSIDKIDHTQWDRLLKKYVDAEGDVDYRAWKSSTQDQKALDDYLAILSRANDRLRASRRAKLAFWINAYNSLTIKGILREYPTTSIRNHTPRVFGYHIWHDLLLQVGDTRRSLHQIEHDILRKEKDPRIHFAIVCASRSCPKLRRHAYTAENLERQVNANAKEFFANRKNFQYDEASKTARVSVILKWFSKDFGANRAQQMRAIASFLLNEKARRVVLDPAVKVSYLNYDWNLNDRKTSIRSATR